MRIDVLAAGRQQQHWILETLRRPPQHLKAIYAGSMTASRVCSAGSPADFALVCWTVMLPGINGFEVLRRLRSVSKIPVLLLTARGEDVDRIVGLEIGADDLSSKTFLIPANW